MAIIIPAEGAILERVLETAHSISSEGDPADVVTEAGGDVSGRGLGKFPKVLEGGPGPTDPSALAKIAVPVLLLHGTRSKPHGWFIDGGSS